MSVILAQEPNPTLVLPAFEVALEQAINAGRLQAALDSINPFSPVTILNAQDTALTNAPAAAPAPQKLSPGAWVGVVIAGLASGAALITLLIYLFGGKGTQKHNYTQNIEYDPNEDSPRSETKGGE